MSQRRVRGGESSQASGTVLTIVDVRAEAADQACRGHSRQDCELDGWESVRRAAGGR